MDKKYNVGYMNWAVWDSQSTLPHEDIFYVKIALMKRGQNMYQIGIVVTLKWCPAT